ncbi:MAG: hypothetical protein WA191_23560 [Telluria sp.]
MIAKPSLMASSPMLPSTTIDYAGCVSKRDLKALASHWLKLHRYSNRAIHNTKGRSTGPS